MTNTQVLLLVGGILLAVLLFIGAIVWFIYRYHNAPADPPTVTNGPGGPVAQIPTRQISVIMSAVPAWAMMQYAVHGTLTIGPEGIEYTRLLRPKKVPYTDIRYVQDLGPHHDRRFLIHFTSGRGISVITASPQGRAMALAELSRWCPVGPQAP